MPRLDHLAVWAHDLDAIVAFYETHFGATAGPRYQNPAKGFASRFLRFDGGARLEIMTSTRLSPPAAAADAPRAGYAHLAIAVGSESGVEALTARLRRAGVPVVDGPRRTGDGYYESVVLDPEGNRVEITA